MNPVWLQIALAEQGQAEMAGEAHNPRILEYHATTALNAKSDETAWCASFVSWVFVQAKMKSQRSARALDWNSWGVSLEQPVLGAVVTFTRKGGGHVGFYMGQRDGKWLILGGNQSNRVSIALYDPAQHSSVRWPADAPLPNAVAPLRKSGVVQGAVVSGLSTVGTLGAGLLSNDNVDRATDWLSRGGTLYTVLGLLGLAGAVYAIWSRAQGKATDARSQ